MIDREHKCAECSQPITQAEYEAYDGFCEDCFLEIQDKQDQDDQG